MKNFTYLQDRAGKIHVYNNLLPTKKDPWLRAECGSPGDFWTLLKYIGPVTCQSCRKTLGMLTQIPLFK